MSNELKPLLPCPMCGTIPTIVNHVHGGVVLRHRPSEDELPRNCWFSNASSYHENAASAVAAWNTRATVQREPVKVPTIHKRWMNHEDKEQAELVYLSDVITALKAAGIEVRRE